MTFSNRKFGVEIEFTGASRYDVRRAFVNAGIPVHPTERGASNEWSIVYDGSVTNASEGGGEAVSPILSGQTGLDMVSKAARVISQSGGRADRTCGLHVHVDATDISIPELRLIAKRYARFEAEIDNFMPRSRRGNSNNFCYSMTAPQVMTYINRCETRGDFYDLSRYYKLNLNSISKHNTIEFRQHSGSINASKIANWVKFCVSFVEESRAIYQRLLNSDVPEAPAQNGSNPIIPSTFNNNDVYIANMNEINDHWFIRNHSSRLSASTIATVLRALIRGVNVDSDTVYTYTPSTVRNAMSALRSQGFRIDHPRGTDYYRLSTYQPRSVLIPSVQTNVFRTATTGPAYSDSIEDSLFAGMEQEIVSFYQERAVELA